MRKRDQRLIIAVGAVAVLACAAALTLAGLREQVIYFVSPSDLVQKASSGHRLRLGGLVVRGSVRRDARGALHFGVTDGAASVEVFYAGLTPDLFREGQGVVTEGVWNGASGFVAERVLAKHDENYMPHEVAEELRRRGEWRAQAASRGEYSNQAHPGGAPSAVSAEPRG